MPSINRPTDFFIVYRFSGFGGIYAPRGPCLESNHGRHTRIQPVHCIPPMLGLAKPRVGGGTVDGLKKGREHYVHGFLILSSSSSSLSTRLRTKSTHPCATWEYQRQKVQGKWAIRSDSSVLPMKARDIASRLVMIFQRRSVHSRSFLGRIRS